MNPIWLRALALVCIFGAVVLAAEVLVRWLASNRAEGRAINRPAAGKARTARLNDPSCSTKNRPGIGIRLRKPTERTTSSKKSRKFILACPSPRRFAAQLRLPPPDSADNRTHDKSGK